ncbi:MAG: hypothetical protein LBQ61_04415 [Spirochaetales bacterium]|nr:hypothetical protein [Spirochaetales bacterium]
MIERDRLVFRAEILKRIREFFSSRNYLEVETPLLSPEVIPEDSLDYFSTVYRSFRRGETEMYLLPSPEIWMKRLLSRGLGNIFQICRCFRNNEQSGSFHNPEFTMLEWYTQEAGYRDSLTLTRELLGDLPNPGFDRGGGVNLRGPFRVMTMEEAFWEFTGSAIAPWCAPGEEGLAALKQAVLKLAPDRLGAPEPPEPPTANLWEGLFNFLFVHLVEPRLPADRPLFLTDYPRRIAVLARETREGPWCERWELYLGGVEIANCYTEEGDPQKVAAYFAARPPRKIKAAADYPAIFHAGFPPVSGTALGLDRLLMILTGAPSLGGVILFPFSDILQEF